jgi:hypothetical protein
MKPNHIRDDGRESKYFHQMLNMMDEDLNPYQYRLMGHYKRVCGDSSDGACWESTRTTAEKCKMSVGKVSKTRRELQQMGYISIEERADDTLLITVIDRMAENIARYANRSPEKQSVHEVNANVHTVNAPVHEVNQRITSEKEPNKNNGETRKRATPSNSKKKTKSYAEHDRIIEAWGKAQHLSAVDMGASLVTRNTRNTVKGMAAWERPPTDEEISAVITNRRYNGVYPLRFLEADVLELRANRLQHPRIIPLEQPAQAAADDSPPATPEQIAEAKRLWEQMLANTNGNSKQQAKGA